MRLFAFHAWMMVFTTLPAMGVEALPTFNKDVAPLLFNNCVVCHRPGDIGPFPLLTYADAKKRAKQIVRVTRQRVMPPWKPEPGFGEFQHERRLTDKELQTFRLWVENGTPEGNPSDLPRAPEFRKGWQLGEPTLVLKMPLPFTVPAEGNDIYQHFVFKTNLKKDMYVYGVEVLPGNRRVAHHAVHLLDASGTAQRLDKKTPEPGYPGMGNAGFLPVGMLPGYVPGQIPRLFQNDAAIPLKRGTDVVLQMHYHPTGKVETDQTIVGLHLTETPPKRKPNGMLLGSTEIDIPAGEPQYVVYDEFELPCAFHVTDVWAHMHMVGKEVKVIATLPDGTERPLLWIKDWDFNWQDVYRYKEPFELPPKTIIRATFTFDNSPENPRNPNNPPKRVQLGEGSTDEMAGLWVGGYTDSDWNDFVLLAANVGHYLKIQSKAKPKAK